MQGDIIIESVKDDNAFTDLPQIVPEMDKNASVKTLKDVLAKPDILIVVNLLPRLAPCLYI